MIIFVGFCFSISSSEFLCFVTCLWPEENLVVIHFCICFLLAFEIILIYMDVLVA